MSEPAIYWCHGTCRRHGECQYVGDKSNGCGLPYPARSPEPPMTRDPLATAARELLDALDVANGGELPVRTVMALREALTHHETHRRREVHPLALAYLETTADAGARGVSTESDMAWRIWDAEGRPIYAAPDPHHAPQHEADAALGQALREAREAWGGAYCEPRWDQEREGAMPWEVYVPDSDPDGHGSKCVAIAATELEALQAALAAAPARRDAARPSVEPGGEEG